MSHGRPRGPAGQSFRRRRLEQRYVALGHVVCRRPWVVIATLVALSLALGAQLPGLEFDTSTDSFLEPDDPARVRYEAFRDEFGRDELIVVALEPAEVFDLDFLAELAEIERELDERVERIDEITSLLTIRSTRGEGDRLIVEDLFARWPRGPAELDRLRRRALDSPLYRDLVISRDGRLTSILIRPDAFDFGSRTDASDLGAFEGGATPARPPPLGGEQLHQIVRQIRAVVAAHVRDDLRIHVAGSPVMSSDLQDAMTRDLRVFVALALLGIALCLGVIFRRVVPVVLPLVVVGLCLLSTFGAMVLSGITLSFGTQLLPSFLLAIGVGYAVHIETIFLQRYAETRDKRDAIPFALGHAGLPVTLSALTTAAGLASFSVAELQPIALLGWFSPVGVGLSLVYSLALVPALLMVAPIAPERARSATAPGPAERLLVGCGRLARRFPRAIAGGAAVALVAAICAATTLRFSHDPLTWLPEDGALRPATTLLDERLHGIMSVELLADAGGPNRLHDPDLLRNLEAVQDFALDLAPAPDALGSGVEVGKATSIVDVVREVNQALHAGDPAFYRIPDDRAQIAQELLLFESGGADDLARVTDPQFSKARMTLKVKWTDSVDFPPFIERISGFAREALGAGVAVEITGFVPMMSETFTLLFSSLSRSYGLAFLVISPLMVLLIGDLRAGLVSMVPNVAPIALCLGLMGALGLELDFFTILIGGIALGLAVDDTIHMIHGFGRNYAETANAGEAIERTLRTTGRAMLFTTVVLCAGFLAFTLSELNNLFRFGSLTAMTVALALVADVLVTPALLVLVAKRPVAAADAGARSEHRGERSP